MKTVHGNVVSTTTISLSKAASILSKFVSADTGASLAVCAYLRRAAASFSELNQLHKELKSNRKHKTKAPKSEIVTEDEKPSRSVVSNEQLSQPELSREPNHGFSDGDCDRKKHKKKNEEKGWFGNNEKSDGEIVQNKVSIKSEENVESDLNVETEKKKHKKKIGEVGNLQGGKGKVKVEEDGNVGMEDEKKNGKIEGEIGISEGDNGEMGIVEEDGDVRKESERKKHKKKRESEIGIVKENGSGVVIEEEGKKKKKKRKIEEVEEEREMNSEESRSKKKKKK